MRVHYGKFGDTMKVEDFRRLMAFWADRMPEIKARLARTSAMYIEERTRHESWEHHAEAVSLASLENAGVCSPN